VECYKNKVLQHYAAATLQASADTSQDKQLWHRAAEALPRLGGLVGLCWEGLIILHRHVRTIQSLTWDRASSASIKIQPSRRKTHKCV